VGLERKDIDCDKLVEETAEEVTDSDHNDDNTVPTKAPAADEQRRPNRGHCQVMCRAMGVWGQGCDCVCLCRKPLTVEMDAKNILIIF